MIREIVAVTRLDMRLKELGIPIHGVRKVNGAFVVDYNGASAGQITQGNSIAATWSNETRKPRGLYSIYVDINALSGTNKTAIWTDLTSGSPPKWALNTGQNQAAIVTLHWSAVNSGATAANLTDARMRLAACYVQDNPRYLVNPSFAAAVNIPGDEAA